MSNPWLPSIERRHGTKAKITRVPLQDWSIAKLKRALEVRSSRPAWMESTEEFGAGVDEIRSELERRGVPLSSQRPRDDG